MPTSQNGYSANDRSMIASYTVPGTGLKIALRKGDVSVILLHYLARYHVEVESLYHTPQDLWGYAERTIRGSSTQLSNHASGSACDARSTRHPLGATGTFTAQELHSLNRLVAYFEGVIRHGTTYVGRKDPMHAEINRGPAEVARIANKIRAGVGSSIPPIPLHPAEISVSLTDRQAAQLDCITQQLIGSQEPWDFKSPWPTWDGGTTENLTVVDYLRRGNVEVRQLHSKVDALGERVGQLSSGGPVSGPASLTDADVDRIATRVIDLLSERTRS